MIEKYLGRRQVVVVGGAALLMGPNRPMARSRPSPIRIIAGFAAGGASGSMARIVAEELQKRLATTVIVENNAGAGGRIAAEAVKAAPADGSHILLADMVMMVVAPLTAPPPKYDPQADFDAVARVADYQIVLTTGPKTGAQNLASLLAWWKSNPGEASYGVAAVGGLPHLFGVALARASGIKLDSVVYRGGAPMAQDLIGGRLVAGLSAAADFAEAHRYGLLRIVASSGTVRHPALADVATFSEAGMAGFEQNGWNGLFVPKGTPSSIRERIERATLDALADDRVQSRLEQLGFIVTPSDGATLARTLPLDQARMARLIKQIEATKP